MRVKMVPECRELGQESSEFRDRQQGMGDNAKEQMREYHNVTAIGYSRQFQEPNWVNDAAIKTIVEHGGG